MKVNQIQPTAQIKQPIIYAQSPHINSGGVISSYKGVFCTSLPLNERPRLEPAESHNDRAATRAGALQKHRSCRPMLPPPIPADCGPRNVQPAAVAVAVHEIRTMRCRSHLQRILPRTRSSSSFCHDDACRDDACRDVTAERDAWHGGLDRGYQPCPYLS